MQGSSFQRMQIKLKVYLEENGKKYLYLQLRAAAESPVLHSYLPKLHRELQ